MSLKRNILSNYAGQFYGTLIGIFMVPVYVRYMGIEAYGLIGFFAMLQIWFQLLDMGLTPTLARETARFATSSEADALQLRRLMRSLEGIFICIAVAGCAALILGSADLAGSWLNVQHLAKQEVQLSIALMAINIGVKWVSGLYRGAITGFERLVWLNGLNVVLATARFLLVVLVFMFIGTSPVDFFGYQLMIAVAELAVLVNKTYRLLPTIGRDSQLPWQWAPLRAVLKFSLSMALANVAWVLVTQSDKLLLSRILPLDEYAYFSLATLMASGIFMLSNPFGIALLPRLTRLSAERNHLELIGIYRESTQLVGVIVIPAVLIMSFFAEQVMWVWTGNVELAHKIAPLLTLYAVGNGIVALGTFPYYLQFAKGDIRFHMIGTVLLVLTLIPSMLWGTHRYGYVGAGYAWVGANLLYFLLWLPLVHGRLVGGLHRQWLFKDIGVMTLCSTAGAALIYYSIAWPADRVGEGLYILLLSLALMAISIASSSQMRKKIETRWRVMFG